MNIEEQQAYDEGYQAYINKVSKEAVVKEASLVQFYMSGYSDARQAYWNSIIHPKKEKFTSNNSKYEKES